MVLNAIIIICRDIIYDESPMELADMRIDSLSFTGSVLKKCKEEFMKAA